MIVNNARIRKMINLIEIIYDGDGVGDGVREIWRIVVSIFRVMLWYL
jgi:hypothetical protein